MDIVKGVLVAYVVPFATWAFVVLVRASTTIFGEESKQREKTGGLGQKPVRSEKNGFFKCD